MSKKIAVLGGGHGGHMMAAEMKLKGHSVNLFSRQKTGANISKLFESGIIKISGVISETVKLDLVTNDIEEAIKGVNYILIATPAFAHEDYANLLKGIVEKEQIVVVFPGAFAALIFKRILGNECPIICEVNNLPYDVRIMKPGEVTLFGRNDTNIAFYPSNKSEELIDELREDLFPFVKVYKDVLEAGLSIVNPAFHTGPCLLNMSNIESPHVDFYIYEMGWTPSSVKVNMALDEERKAIGIALGYKLRPLEDFSGMDDGYTWQDLYMAGHGNISLTRIQGPNDINDRYMTEDAPFGLVPWASIGKVIGVPTPITDGIINLYNIIHEKDWRVLGNNAEKLGIEDMTVEEILKFVQTNEN